MTPYGKDGGPDLRQDAKRRGYAVYLMHFTDLENWQKYYRHPAIPHTVDGFSMTNGELTAQTNFNVHVAGAFPIGPQPQTAAKYVLLALSKFDSAVEELRQASHRPYANIPENYAGGFDAVSPLLPIFAELKSCSQLLQLRVSAELANGQNTKALDDVKLSLYLGNSLRNSPFLISYLVRMAITEIGLQPIWEGLAKHEWSDSQLAELDSNLARLDFLADYGFVIRGERAFEILSFEQQRRTHEIILPDGSTVKLRWMPSAYFYQNELAFAQMSEQWILPLVNTNTRVISPTNLRRADAGIHAERQHYSPYKAQALMLFPSLSSMVKKVAALQSSVDLARVVCALERYRLAHSHYPDSLAILEPQFIAQVPHDIINGQPLHYRLKPNGQFVLYSVGWNGTDDGGVVVLDPNYGNMRRDEGDWVWQYPEP
jgi:hypothetical protein